MSEPMPTEQPTATPTAYEHATLLRAGGKPRYLLAHEVAELKDPRPFYRALVELAVCAAFFGLLCAVIGVVFGHG